jgi:hypothetical protein
MVVVVEELDVVAVAVVVVVVVVVAGHSSSSGMQSAGALSSRVRGGSEHVAPSKQCPARSVLSEDLETRLVCLLFQSRSNLWKPQTTKVVVNEPPTEFLCRSALHCTCIGCSTPQIITGAYTPTPHDRAQSEYKARTRCTPSALVSAPTSHTQHPRDLLLWTISATACKTCLPTPYFHSFGLVTESTSA